PPGSLGQHWGSRERNLYYAPNSSQPFWRESTNTYYSWTSWRALGYDANGLNTDALLVNVTNKDFHLQSTSPAIDAGLTLVEVTTDFLCSRRGPAEGETLNFADEALCYVYSRCNRRR